MGGLAHRHARADIRIRQIGMLRRALALGLIEDLHELVTAGPIVELNAVDGKAVYVERSLIGKSMANHEDKGGWGRMASFKKGDGDLNTDRANSFSPCRVPPCDQRGTSGKATNEGGNERKALETCLRCCFRDRRRPCVNLRQLRPFLNQALMLTLKRSLGTRAFEIRRALFII